jgi:hypothetical protein
MHSVITFTNGASSFSIPTPEYDYTVSHTSNLFIIRTGNKYQGWDNGSAKDFRVCSCSFLNNENDAVDLRSIASAWRNSDITMHLPNNSGFFPCGPDKVNEGTFNIKLLSVEPEGMLLEPWKYSRTRFKFLIKTPWPAANVPSLIPEGDFSIGSISGLAFPFDFPAPVVDYGLNAANTQSGQAVYSDRGSRGQHLETTFTLPLCHANAAQILHYLTNTVRHNDITLIPPANSYLFGAGFGDTASYVCKLLNETISIKHLEWDTFEIPLSFGLKSYS